MCVASLIRKCKDCGANLTPRVNIRIRYRLRCEPCHVTSRVAQGLAWRQNEHGQRSLRETNRRQYEKKRQSPDYIPRKVQEARLWRERNPERTKQLRINHEQTRRARRKQSWVERVDSIKVFERDAYICWLCEKPAVTPSMDHVVPLAKGGKHEYANIRTACTSCNIKKGTKLIGPRQQV